MYVSAWPGLTPASFVRSPSESARPFPLNTVQSIAFYRARNAIYHLFRALDAGGGGTVLVPDYHSGNEIAAIRAAGARVRFYHVGRDLQPDLEQIERLCRDGARALLTIHYLGWPQPVDELARITLRHGTVLVEDCALAMLSELKGWPLGTFGQHAIFCLYKTLPLPHGGLAVQNCRPLKGLNTLDLRPCGGLSLAGRTAELFLEHLRSAADTPGRILFALKRGAGRALSALQVDRVPVGDMGFDLDAVDVAMSPMCQRLLQTFDYQDIHRRRRANYLHLSARLSGRITPLFPRLDEGVCPLFFPLLVSDKHEAARSLWRRGIQAIEFWNGGDPEATGSGFEDAQFLRDHVLELPIHQDITATQLDYMADRILGMDVGVVGHSAHRLAAPQTCPL